MLVLTRKIDESIIIGEHTAVTILGIEGDSVKLGITAPRDIAIHRREIFELIKAANQEAARSASSDISSVLNLLPPRDK